MKKTTRDDAAGTHEARDTREILGPLPAVVKDSSCDIFDDPVSYLASLGIESHLVEVRPGLLRRAA